MKNILFLCTGNSCRSQMAHGFMSNVHGQSFNVYSAGIETHGLNPRAVEVMKEVGVDISTHTSNLLSEYDDIDFDYVVTVCSHAHETCPMFPKDAKIIHIGFDDPPGLTKELVEAGGDEQEVLAVYRRVRDEIKEEISKFRG